MCHILKKPRLRSALTNGVITQLPCRAVGAVGAVGAMAAVAEVRGCDAGGFAEHCVPVGLVPGVSLNREVQL